jgi:hypothetical protein
MFRQLTTIYSKDRKISGAEICNVNPQIHDESSVFANSAMLRT